MEKGKQHLDDFLREKLGELPNAPVPGFEQLEKRMAARQHRGVISLLLVPFLLSGLFWLANLHESDLVLPQKNFPKVLPITAPSQVTEPPQALEVRPKTKTDFVPSAEKSERQNLEITPVAVAVALPESAAAETSPLLYSQLSVNQVEEESVLKVASEREQPQGEVEPVDEQAAEVAAILPLISSDEASANQAVSNSAAVISPMLANATRWSVHANFYPNYTFRDLEVKPEYQGQVSSRFEEILAASEKGGFAFNAGITVRYDLGNDLFLGSGLGFIEMKVNGVYDFDIYEEIDVAKTDATLVQKTESVTAMHAIPINQGIIQAYRYLQVPLHISYQPWASNKLRLLIEGGVSYIRFLQADGTTLDPETLTPVPLNQMNYTQNLGSFDVKIGFAYFVNQQVSVGLEPSLMYFSQSIFAADNPLYVVPWSVGVNFNVSMRLF